jgi:hypothetical protein
MSYDNILHHNLTFDELWRVKGRIVLFPSCIPEEQCGLMLTFKGIAVFS